MRLQRETKLFVLKYIAYVFFFIAIPVSSLAEFSIERPARIQMVVWRGCEAACRGFQSYFSNLGLPVKIEVIDVAKDKSILPDIRRQIISDNPDLVLTWGTSVSVGIIGKKSEFGDKSALGDIPAVFMIVADPVGSNIVESYEKSGRLTVTGVRNRVPEKVQLNLMFEYYHPKKLGVLYDPNELNSKLNTEKLETLSAEMNFELLVHEYKADSDGFVDENQIPTAIKSIKDLGATAIYVGSSSYNLVHQKLFVDSASELGLPVFSAYGKMVQEAGAVMAVATRYFNVGKLAAAQAAEILFKNGEPSQMPIKSLDRFTLFVNMGTAKKIGLYPPLSILKVAEIVK